MGINFIKKHQILGISKSFKKSEYSWKKLNICNRIVNFEVENFDHLHLILELIKNRWIERWIDPKSLKYS